MRISTCSNVPRAATALEDMGEIFQSDLPRNSVRSHRARGSSRDRDCLRIMRFPILVTPDLYSIRMPRGARVLCVSRHHGEQMASVEALVTARTHWDGIDGVERKFRVFDDADIIPPDRPYSYVCSFTSPTLERTLHLFEF